MKILFLMVYTLIFTSIYADNARGMTSENLKLNMDALHSQFPQCKDSELKSLESLPIQQGGRVKPLYVHAHEVIKELTGKSKISVTLENGEQEKIPAVIAYCLLSSESLTSSSSVTNEMTLRQNFLSNFLKTHIEHVDVLKLLNRNSSQKDILFTELIPNEEVLRSELMKLKVQSSYKTSLNSLYNKLFLYKEITSGENWKISVPIREQSQWLSLNVINQQMKVEGIDLSSNPNIIQSLVKKSQEDYVRLNNDDYLLELTYAKAHLAEWSLIITLLALASLVLLKKLQWPLGLSVLTLTLQTAFLILRILISKRAPITNMYETVLFSGYGALLLSMAIGHFKKQNIYLFIGLGYNVCSLMMINFANGMLSATIGPLVPVLRDNFWLSTHVTTIILSYGALALSWILANRVLIKSKFKKLTQEEFIESQEIMYNTLKYGTTLLALGIILGGVWADYSWGRFWGWDPKETWSLIVLCIYMAILHGRYTTWINGGRFIITTGAAFMSVMMAWFGVNYILASGLHSYGFSQGGAFFLGAFFTIQILILVLTKNSLKEFEKKKAS